MYLPLLQIRDATDLARYVALVARADRLRGRLDARPVEPNSGSNVAPDFVARAAGAAMRACGQAVDDAAAEAATRGYSDLIRLVMDHAGEVPFIESQVKYFHSLLLRHDASAAGHRRQYRPDEPIGREMPELVAWTREMLETGRLHALLAIGVFLFRFLAIRPFAGGNARLALALAVYLLDRYGYTHVRIVPFEETVAERREAFAAAAEDSAAWVCVFLDAVCESEAIALDRTDPAASVRLSPRLGRLLEVMRERKAAKIGDLLPVLATPRATLKKDLRALVDAGYLTAEGVRKGTVYHISGQWPVVSGQ
jgi:hypothetical protein